MAIDAEADRLLADAADRARRYLAGLDDRAVVPDRAALSALASFDEPLPESPGDPAATLALLDEAGSPATVTSAGGRYFGFVTGGSWPVAVAANWLAAAWDQNAALPVMSPVAARLHEVVTRWLADLLGLPAGTAVVFVTGSAMANTAALTTARDQQLARAGWDVQANGLFGAPELPVVIGENAHTTLVRALGVVGLGRERVIRIPVDDQGRIRADRLPKDVAGPAVICAQAGEVNTGAFDPFPAMVSWARERDAWLHVDGAFGLWALADPSRAHLTAGLAGADSWAADAHKWLNVPYDSGVAFTAHPETHRATFAARAAYLTASTHTRDNVDWVPEHSRRARGFPVYAAIRSLGRDGIRDIVERCCDHAQAFAVGIRELGAEVLNDVVLNQVLFRFATDDETNTILASVQQSGEAFMSGTTWDGRAAIRFSVSNWQTTDDDVRRTLAAYAGQLAAR